MTLHFETFNIGKYPYAILKPYLELIGVLKNIKGKSCFLFVSEALSFFSLYNRNSLEDIHRKTEFCNKERW